MKRSTREDRRERGGTSLAIITMALGLAALLGNTLMQSALMGSRSGDANRDRLVLRLLADSATTELVLRFQESMNQPGSSTFRVLRRGAAGAAIDGLVAYRIENEIQSRAAELGGQVSLVSTVTLVTRTATSSDAAEAAGVVRFEAVVALKRTTSTVTRKVAIEHEFRVARTTLPGALDDVALTILRTSRRTLPNFPQGKAAFARTDSRERTLLDLVTAPAPDGLQPLEAANVLSVLRTVTPVELASRAHYVTRSVAELEGQLRRLIEAGRPVEGVYHNESTEPLLISIAGFRGRCLISSNGPIQVGNVQMQDSAKDRLTLVSKSRIIVTGQRVEASLVSLADPRVGVVFARRASVTGAVLSSIFPGRAGITGRELSECQVSAAPALQLDPDGVYHAAVSPYPVRVSHDE